jgi:hypothetical protein
MKFTRLVPSKIFQRQTVPRLDSRERANLALDRQANVDLKLPRKSSGAQLFPRLDSRERANLALDRRASGDELRISNPPTIYKHLIIQGKKELIASVLQS